MIADLWLEVLQHADSDLLADVIAVIAWFSGAFCLGVGWAAYRAVGWTERIRAWAYTSAPLAPIEHSCIANAELEGMGLE